MIRQLPLWSDSNTEMLKRPQRTAFCTREAQSYRSLEFVLLSLCPGLSSTLLIRQKFNVVIVDEAGQISQPAVIGALMAAITSNSHHLSKVTLQRKQVRGCEFIKTVILTLCNHFLTIS